MFIVVDFVADAEMDELKGLEEQLKERENMVRQKKYQLARTQHYVKGKVTSNLMVAKSLINLTSNLSPCNI